MQQVKQIRKKRAISCRKADIAPLMGFLLKFSLLTLSENPCVNRDRVVVFMRPEIYCYDLTTLIDFDCLTNHCTAPLYGVLATVTVAVVVFEVVNALAHRSKKFMHRVAGI